MGAAVPPQPPKPRSEHLGPAAITDAGLFKMLDQMRTSIDPQAFGRVADLVNDVNAKRTHMTRDEFVLAVMQAAEEEGA